MRGRMWAVLLIAIAIAIHKYFKDRNANERGCSHSIGNSMK